MSLDSNPFNDDLGIANGCFEFLLKSYMDQPLIIDDPTNMLNLYSIGMIFSLNIWSSLDASKVVAISPRVLKQCAGTITLNVFHLLNLCISSCSFLMNDPHIIQFSYTSQDLRHADIKNYHQISAFCILLKLLEKLIMYDDLLTDRLWSLGIRGSSLVLTYRTDSNR